jgi:hypothetical protein
MITTEQIVSARVVWSIYWNRVESTRVYELSMDSANFPRKELLMLPDFLRVVYGRVYPRTLKVLRISYSAYSHHSHRVHFSSAFMS